MSGYLYLIPISLCLGAVGLAAFFWSLKSGQYEDLDGAAERVLFDDDEGPPAKLGNGAELEGAEPRPLNGVDGNRRR